MVDHIGIWYIKLSWFYHTNDKRGQETPVGFMGPIAGTQIKIIKLNQYRVQMSDTEICEILPWVDVKGCIH